MVRQLAAGLVQSGIDTHVATTDDNGPDTVPARYGEPTVQDGVTYWFFPRQLRFYTASWPLARWLSHRVADFDVVHIHALFSFAALPASFFAARRNVPYIVRPLGTLNHWGMAHRRPWLKSLSFRLIERRILSHAALVHYTSAQEQREAETLGVYGESVVIPIAVADSSVEGHPGAFLARHPQLRGRRVVLFLSRLDPKKGLDLLLNSFVEVRRRFPTASLVIAGDGPAEFVDTVKSYAEKLGVASDVTWTGFLSGDNKAGAFAAADVFALPSYSENFGIAVAEAMAAGVPVVVSDQVAVHRDIAAAEAGLVVRCDAAHLSQALLQLLGDGDLRKSMGQRGKALVAQQYSQTATTRHVIETYNRIAH